MIEVFEYRAGPQPPAPALSAWEGLIEAKQEPAIGTADSLSASASGGSLRDSQQEQFERKMAEESSRSPPAGREHGLQEGRKAERDVQTAARIAGERRLADQVAALIESFAQERDSYLQTAEREVVKLALAVAARILRREAQMDPLLLTGAVRVALGQLSKTTQVRLLVPAAELDLWTEAIALLPNLALKPTVLAGEGMRLGDCAIESELGSVDLGIRAQLAEIERGFFDRAGGRSAEVPARGDNSMDGKTGVRP